MGGLEDGCVISLVLSLLLGGRDGIDGQVKLRTEGVGIESQKAPCLEQHSDMIKTHITLRQATYERQS